uniref:uncharacterized protein LOC117605739 n=1 Tax=Osmia lignaria TaxID=473952 RepID=UPI001478179D|nr:uncharacterized protein LOC117605739 [Osmia lignaria]
MYVASARRHIRAKERKEEEMVDGRRERWLVVARHPRKMHRTAHGNVEKIERVKAMPQSATLATQLGAELKARILPQRGDAALAPHKSFCFCLQQGGENRWCSPPTPSLLSHPPTLPLSTTNCAYLYT